MSTATIAQLVVELSANAARFTEGMNTAQRVTAQTTKLIEDSAKSARRALEGMVAGLTVGAGVAMVKGAIDAADALNDLSQKTGIAVEKLGGLEYAAKASGTNLEGVAVGVRKLEVNMADAAGGGEAAARMFQQLGVAIKGSDGSLRSADETLLELADRFAKFEDGPEKAAAAVRVFGKSGTDMIPLLNMGGEALRTMIAEYEKYGGINAETAARADQFNDTLNQLHMMGGALARTIASALLPTLQAIADVFVEAKQKGDDFNQTSSAIVEIVKGLAVTGLYVAEVFRSIGVSIGAAAAAIATVMSGGMSSVEWKRAAEATKAANQDLANNWDTTMKRIERIWTASTATIAVKAEEMGPKVKAPVLAAAGAVDELVKMLQDAEKVARDAALAFEDYGKAADQKTMPALKRLLDVEASPAFQALPKAKQDAVRAIYEQAAATQQLIAWMERETKETMASIAASEAAAEAKARESQARVDLVNGYAEANEWLAREVAIIGDDALAHRMLAAEREYEAAKARLGAEATQASIDKLAEEYELRKKLIAEGFAKEQAIAYQREWGRALESVSSGLASFFVDLAEHGSSAFKRLWDSFKRWALEALAQVAARQVVVSIVSSVGLGGAAGSAAANTLGSLGGGGLVSGISSAGGLLSGIGGIFGLGSGASLGIGTALQNIGTILPTLMQTGSVSAAFAGMGASFAALVPWAAVAAIAIPMIVGAFDKGDAMRVGRWSQGGVPANADTNKIGRSAFGAFGISSSQWFGDDMNSAFATLIKSVQGLDNAIAAAVGPAMTAKIAAALTGQGISAQWGMEHTDFNQTGTSGEILRQRYTIALNTINQGLGDLIAGFSGTGEELATFIAGLLQLNASLSDSATMMATFGQAITLEDLKSAAKAGEQITDTFKRLTSVFAATNSVAFMLGKDVATAFGAVGLASIEARQKLVDLAGGVQALNDKTSWYYSNFLDDTDRAALLLPSVTKTMTDLGYGSVTTVEQFKALVKSIDLSTESGLALYNGLMDIAPEFLLVARNAQTAAQAVNTVAAALGPSGLLTTHLRTMIGGPGAGGALYGAVNGNARPDFGAQRAQVIADNLAAVNQALEDLGALADPVAAAFASMASAWDQLIAQGNQLDALTAYYDGSAASTQALAQATQSYYQAVVQTIGAIEQLKGSIGDLWAGNIRAFTMDTMDNEAKYAYLRAETESLMAQLQAATDPARIQALSQQIATNQSQAWGLLSPEQKAQQQGQFIAGAQFANEVAQARLAEAEKLAKERADALVDAVRDAMAEAAAKFSGAADKQGQAADAMQDAAATIANTHITVDVNTNESSTVGTYGINLPRKR